MTTPESPYRSDLDALRERKTNLEGEIARLREQVSELETLRAREAELARELAAVDSRLHDGATKRALPMLDNVRVASPCNASWDDMVGDDRSRFCLKCDKHVYNLSAMGSEEAEALLRERASGAAGLCVRFYRRADGTVMTEDCPVGVTKKRRKKAALAIAGAGALAFTAMQMFARSHTMGEMAAPYQGKPVVMGDVATPGPASTDEPTGATQGQAIAPAVMGTTTAIPPPPPAPIAPPHGKPSGVRGAR